MSGIHPNSGDGGVACTVAVPPGFCPVSIPVLTDPLYFGAGCQLRLRPELVNAIISELRSTIDGQRVPYNPNLLTNLKTAVNYAIQEGAPQHAYVSGGPNAYVGALSPTFRTPVADLTSLIIMPDATSAANPTLKIDGAGPYPIYRNDGVQLRQGDLRALVPVLVIYVGGRWYVPYLVPSQVPIILTGNVDAWIRTDGNDVTGDGGANTAARAFRTIAGAWSAIGQRYAASPVFSINLRLGIPGDYIGTAIQDYGGKVRLVGDAGNRSQYRIRASASAPLAACIQVSAANLDIIGVECWMDTVAPNSCIAVFGNNNANISFSYSDVVVPVSNPNSTPFYMNSGASLRFNYSGNNGLSGTTVKSSDAAAKTISALIQVDSSGKILGAYVNAQGSLTSANMIYNSAAVIAQSLSLVDFLYTITVNSVNLGPNYNISTNSILNLRGQTGFGSTPGSTGTGGQAIP